MKTNLHSIQNSTLRAFLKQSVASTWMAITMLMLASAFSVPAAIVFDDFNVNEGHFNGAPSSVSGGTCTLDRVTTGAPLEGAGHQAVVFSALTSGAMRVRNLSGGGTPANNTTFTTTAGVDGWIGFFVKTTSPGWTVQLWKEGASIQGGTPKAVIADGMWHVYEWNLDDNSGGPDGWGAVAGFVAGSPTIVNGGHQIDSIMVRNTANTAGTLYIDYVAKSDSGSIASLPTLNQTITFGAIANKVYGDTFDPGATSDSALPVTYSIISGSASVSGSTVTVTGNSGSVTVRASQAGNGSYAAAPDVDRTFNVSPAPLTVTADDLARAYGAANPTLTASYNGFKLGETLNTSDLSGAPELTTLADVNSASGVHAITISSGTLASANYSLNFVAGSLTVTQALLTVTANDFSRFVGGNNPTLTSTYTGFANGETAAVLSGAPLLTTTASPASPAGTYPISASLGSLSAANYSFAFVDGTLSVVAASTNIYFLQPSDLATGKPSFSPPHGTGTNSFAYDWDSAAPTTAIGAPSAFGTSSFYANVQQAGATAPDRYRTFRLGLRTLFGANVTLADVASFSYKTRKNTPATAVDWRLTIYTTHQPSNPGNAASWYRSRLQATPNLALSLNAPASQWNPWSTDSGNNQLQFKDNRTGFTTENVLWSELTSGPVTRGANTWDWTAEEVMMIDLTLGANSGGGNASSQADAVEIRLNNGALATINFEQAVTTASHTVLPSSLATGKPDFSPPHGTGANPFAYDWDSTLPDTAYGASAGFGESSFAASVTQTGATAVDRYRTFRVGLQSLFGHPVTVGELVEVTYQTRKNTPASAVDWRMTIYTATNTSPGNVASWYRSRLQSTPNLALNLDAPAAQWNQWTTGSGDNQLQFKDNRTGFGTENILWSEIVAGPVTRGANTWDWTTEEVMMIDLTLGANSGGGTASSQVDAVQFRLANGEIAVMNLEQVATTNSYAVYPSLLATGKPDFSAPHGTGTNAFAYDWDSLAPDPACGGAPGYGQSSFSANVTQAGATAADRYRTLRVGARSLFGRVVTVGELANVVYQTKKNTPQTGIDWRMTIYTTHEPLNSGNAASWYRSRLQSTPNLALNLDAPAAQWNQWTTGSGDNQLQFKDNRTGFTTENILWSEIVGGPVTRGASTWNWTAEEVMMIDITLGANSGGGNAFSQLDGLRLRLNNGEVAEIDLESTFSTDSVYVDADYIGLSPGTAVTFPDGAGGIEHIIGCDAFASIQDAIDTVATNGTVNVAAGTYFEDLTISKALSLVGPNAEINPNTGVRVAEAILRPFTSDPNPNTAVVGVIIYLTASDVSIIGLTVDGDNTSITSGITVGGVDCDAIEAISSYDGVGSIIISNNIIRNTTYAGLDLYNYYNAGVATTGNHIQNNRFDNIGHIPYNAGMAVLIYNNFYAQISGNVITNVRIGVQTGNFFAATPGTLPVISDNVITSTRQGVWHNGASGASTPFTISNNVISVLNEAGTTRWNGIMVSTMSSSVSAVVVNNTISATPVTQTTSGYQVWSNPTSQGVILSGGSVTGANYGVFANNYDGYTAPGGATALTLSGLNISGASLAGVYVKDNPLDPDSSVVQVTLNNCSISASTIGLLVDGDAASALPGNTSFSGITGDYIQLANGSITDQNATSTVFDGKTGSAMTTSELLATEAKILHELDNVSLGFVQIKAATLLVTPGGAGIQAAINAASPGDTIYVAPGTYTENVNVNKSVTLLGANAGVAGCAGRGAESTINGGTGTAINITANDVTVDGFGLTGAIGFRAINRVGVVARNNAITAAAVGIDVETITTTPSATVSLQGNCVTLASQLAGSTPTIGIYLAGVTGPQGIDVSTNTVSGAFYGYALYNVNATASTLIKGGTVSGAMQGVAVFNIDPVTLSAFAPTRFALDDLNISGFTGNYPSSPNNNFHAGVYVFTGGPVLTAQITGSVNNLNVTGTGKISADSAAIYLGDFSTGVGTRQQITMDNCSIVNNLNRGISVRGSNAVATVSRSTISNNGSDAYGIGGNVGAGIMARLGSTVTVTESFIVNPATVAGAYSVYGLFTGETPFPSLTVNNCSLSNNGNPSGQIANAYNGTINASGNWWSDNTVAGISALATANVDYTPWLDSGTDTSASAGFQGDFTTLNVDDNSPQTGATGRIQEGVNSVSGSTVLVGPGSYSENILITNNVTIEGAGSGSNPALDTIVTAAAASTPVVRISAGGVSALDRLTLRDLRLTGATGTGNPGTGIALISGGSFYEFDNVVSTGNAGHGFALTHLGANNDIVITSCSFSANGGAGFRIPTAGSVDGLAVTLSRFDGNVFGLEAYMANGSGSVFKNVSIADSSFDNNTLKGIYVEKLSDALWQCLSVTNSGTSGSFSAGIDINLKYAAYQNIQILDSTITGCGTGDAVNGAGLTVKARDDAPSYNGNPASLNNVTLSGLTISGSPDAIRFGETAKNNLGPLNASVSYCDLSGNTRALRNESLALTDADTNWWGSVSGPTALSNPGGSGGFASANVDFSPWLGTSADTSLSCGFQPNPVVINFTAASLVFVTQPAGAGDGQPFTTQPVVHVLDENGDLATAFNGPVALRVTNNLIGGTLIGMNEVNAVNGVAAFSGLAVTPAGIFTLIADSTGLASATSDPFEVFGLPVITVQPQDIVGPVNQGSNVTFSVVAINGTLTYQWRTNGIAVSGATGSSFVWANTQPADTSIDFSVVVSNETGPVTSDNASILAVKPDSTAPLVTVTTPAKNKGTNLASINVTGVVKDTGAANSGIITSVQFVHNGGLPQNASFAPGTTAGTWNFTSASPITLTPGTNTMSVWAVDLAGNVSTLAPFVFFYDLVSPLTINIVGSGYVKMGTTNWTAPQTVVPNFFKVGRPYTFDAYVNSGANFIFTNWTTAPVNFESSTNVWVQRSKYTFVMQEDMTVNVNFITNPFTALAGKFNGLFADPNNVQHEQSGFIQVLVKGKSTYSGHLFFDGFKRPFTGKFNLDGTTTTTVTRSKFVLQPPVQLSLNLNGELVTGSVSETNAPWTSAVNADKAVFTVLNPETENDGRYTFHIPTGAGAPSLSPGGIGYGTVSNNSLGIIALSGLLGDGEKLTQKVSISRQGQWPLYVPLYKNPALRYQGSVMGWVTFNDGDFGPSSNNVVNWIKKNGSASLARYAAGFSNSVPIHGSPYVSSAPFPISVGDRIILRDGNLPEPVTNTVTSIDGLRVNYWTTNSLNVAIRGSIGFRPRLGTFYPVDQNTIQAVVLQNTNLTAGFFLGPTESGSMTVEKN